MELKWRTGLGKEELEQLSDDALQQIDIRRYDAEMIESGIPSSMQLTTV